MRRPRRQSAFTLVELLLALTFMAILLGVTYAAYLTAVQAAAGWGEVVGIERQGRLLMDLMACDLRCARSSSLSRESRPAEEDEGPGRVLRRAERPSFVGRGDVPGEAFLQFHTTAGIAAPGHEAGGLSVVAYRLTPSDGVLWRRQLRIVERPDAESDGGRWTPVARGVQAAACRFYDAREWRDRWDSDSEKGLPAAARVSVTLADGAGRLHTFETTAALACVPLKQDQEKTSSPDAAAPTASEKPSDAK